MRLKLNCKAFRSHLKITFLGVISLLSSASSFFVKPIIWQLNGPLNLYPFAVDSTDESSERKILSVDTDNNFWEVASPRNDTSLSQSDHLVELKIERRSVNKITTSSRNENLLLGLPRKPSPNPRTLLEIESNTRLQANYISTKRNEGAANCDRSICASYNRLPDFSTSPIDCCFAPLFDIGKQGRSIFGLPQSGFFEPKMHSLSRGRI